MAQIELTKGYMAIVDDEDYDRVNAITWCAAVALRKDRSIRDVYASSHSVVGGKARTIYLHRFILGITDRKIHVDHKNHNGLDNRRSNLRTCTRAQNQANQRIGRSNTSGFKGVYWDKKGRRWQAKIGDGGKMRHIGNFINKDEAAEAYAAAANKTFGEFAYTGRSQ